MAVVISVRIYFLSLFEAPPGRMWPAERLYASRLVSRVFRGPALLLFALPCCMYITWYIYIRVLCHVFRRLFLVI